MNIGLQQLVVFFLMLATGCIGGVCFDFYRAIRYTAKPRKIGILIGDLLFWVCWGIILFSILLFVNSAQLRSYVFVGLFLGAVIYFWKLSKMNIPILIKVVGLLKTVLGWLKKVVICICLIIKTIVGIIYRLLRAPFALLKKIYRWMKKKVSKILPKPPADDEEPWDEQ